MSILKIVKYPDPILRRKSSSVEVIDDNLRKLMDDMRETMYAAQGLGLAAVQVGVLKRIFVLDDSEERNKPQYFINPVIRNISEEKKLKSEGCLSLVSDSAEVMRYEEIEVEYLDYNGDKKIIRVEGLKAHIIQHEFDHLEGVLYSDHLSGIKKFMIKRKALKIAARSGKKTDDI